MLYAIAVTMIALWLLAVPTHYIRGEMIHVLLLVALVAIVLRLTRRQNVWVTPKPDTIQRKSTAPRRGQSNRLAKGRPMRALLLWGSSYWHSL
jgi:hypothetical protein